MRIELSQQRVLGSWSSVVVGNMFSCLGAVHYSCWRARRGAASWQPPNPHHLIEPMTRCGRKNCSRACPAPSARWSRPTAARGSGSRCASVSPASGLLDPTSTQVSKRFVPLSDLPEIFALRVVAVAAHCRKPPTKSSATMFSVILYLTKWFQN